MAQRWSRDYQIRDSFGRPHNTCSLFFRQGTSDKYWRVTVVRARLNGATDDVWLMLKDWGRRSSFQLVREFEEMKLFGAFRSQAASLSNAGDQCDAKVREGYTTWIDGEPYTCTKLEAYNELIQDRRATGVTGYFDPEEDRSVTEHRVMDYINTTETGRLRKGHNQSSDQAESPERKPQVIKKRRRMLEL